ncbi:MAG: C25 family cysteine peptidase, partial [Anaerolineae bacterium]
LEQALEQSLVNYETASTWRAPQAPVLDSTPWAPPQPGYKILVEEEGLHHLTFAQLQAAIPDPGLAQVDPATFQIFAGGEEVAIYVAGDDDQPLLTPRDVLFYAHDIGDKYTAQKVYWFTYGQQPGLRMTTRDGTPAGASAPPAYQQDFHFEENLNYWNEMPPADIDLERYYSDYAFQPPAYGVDEVMAYDVNLENVVTSGAYSATLEISLLGYTHPPAYPDHHTQVLVNGNPLGEVIPWDGLSRLTRSFLISQGDLQEGLNTIEVQLPGVAGQDWNDWQLLDWFNLGYYRDHVVQNNRLSFRNDNDGQWEYLLQGFDSEDIWLFDVTDPARVVQVVSGTVEAGADFELRFQDTVSGEIRYEAANTAAFHTPVGIVADTPSDWGQPTHGADYIIITHADFLTQAEALKAQKESLGLRTVVVDVEDLYDEFNYGVLSPHAIRGFLAYAYANWAPPAPAYVLLIGDGHYDYKDNEGIGKPNLVPPWMQYLPPGVIPNLLGESPADNRYVTIVGPDNIPDMHIGRFPVNNAAEAEAMLAKTLNYAGAADGDWRRRLLMVADDPDPTAGRNFHQLSDELVSGYLDGAYNVERAYLGDPTTCPYQNPATECNQKVINGINAGALLVNYVGHAYSAQWAFERLFNVDDVAGLASRSDWPIVLGMDCNDGYFANPNPIYEALAEVLTVADARGSVANWSSAAFGFAESHQYLEYGFFQAVFLDGVRELGPATLAGKLVAYSKGAVDTLDGYHLFGDPALRLRALDADVHVTKSVEPTTTLAPGEWLTYTLTFGNHGPGTAHHVVLTDVMPAELVNAAVVYASPEVVNQNPGIEFAWAITDILSGTRGLIQLRAMVDPDLNSGIILNDARIAMAEPDTDLRNNRALSWPTTVRSKVYLPIVLRAHP